MLPGKETLREVVDEVGTAEFDDSLQQMQLLEVLPRLHPLRVTPTYMYNAIHATRRYAKRSYTCIWISLVLACASAARPHLPDLIDLLAEM